MPRPDVVIPVWNAETTIERIVNVLQQSMVGNIFVSVDNQASLKTREIVWGLVTYGHDHGNPVVMVPAGCHGKGQVVKAGLYYVTTPRVLFIDADLEGLTVEHVNKLARDYPGQVIGVPVLPANYPTDPNARRSWPWVSGQRCVPKMLVKRMPLHGYLMETQINTAVHNQHLTTRFEMLDGLYSPYNMSGQRIADRERDRKWGQENGVL